MDDAGIWVALAIAVVSSSALTAIVQAWSKRKQSSAETTSVLTKAAAQLVAPLQARIDELEESLAEEKAARLSVEAELRDEIRLLRRDKAGMLAHILDNGLEWPPADR